MIKIEEYPEGTSFPANPREAVLRFTDGKNFRTTFSTDPSNQITCVCTVDMHDAVIRDLSELDIHIIRVVGRAEALARQ